jgi:hypothetical protein
MLVGMLMQHRQYFGLLIVRLTDNFALAADWLVSAALSAALLAAVFCRSLCAGKPSKDSGGSHEQQYVRQVIALHDKYLAYVGTCFANSSLFHKALKEAFEGFCNKNVAGSTSAELMANFCDNILKKVGCSSFMPVEDIC